MSGEPVELVFTDLPEPVSRRVPEYMTDVQLFHVCAYAGLRSGDRFRQLAGTHRAG